MMTIIAADTSCNFSLKSSSYDFRFFNSNQFDSIGFDFIHGLHPNTRIAAS